MKLNLADIPVNILDGLDKYPRAFLCVGCFSAGLGISSAFNQSTTGIWMMAGVLLSALAVAWYLGKPK